VSNLSVPPVVESLVRGLRVALDAGGFDAGAFDGGAHGGGAAVAPLPRLHDDAPLPPGTALVVRTSGSTGTPREVALTAAALVTSATATHERLGGPGRWVLTLPPTHIAGIQVLVRSLLAADDGVPAPLVAADPGAHFTPAGLAALLTPALADGAPVHLSLVPTQLHRVLAAADDADSGSSAGPSGRDALDALARCTSVLVGGAATPPALLARATAAGVPVVRTYGMSETAGGCVYDGVPLRGVRLRVSPPGTGVVEIAGPMLAAEYVGDPAATAVSFHTDDDGTRWFRTSDLGALGPDGSLTVLGRADDVVVTGGVNVAPAAVEAALAEVLPPLLADTAGRTVASRTLVVEVCVVGVSDAEWGQALVAVVVLPPDARHAATGTTASTTTAAAGDGGWPTLAPLDPALLARVRAAVAARLGAPSAPRQILVTGALPLRGPGKVDRRAVAQAAAHSIDV
jgi:O-succinylbenzoic acid--CoA ligase